MTANGTYTREDGYSAITVNVPTGSTINNQSKSLNITANTSTTITYDNGYTGLENVALVVNVAQTGHTDEEIEDAYNSGYTSGRTDGEEDGFSSGYTSGRTDGFSSGYTSGTTDGFSSGYTAGYNSGYTSGWTDGYASGSAEVAYCEITINISSDVVSPLVNVAEVYISYSSFTDTYVYSGTPIVANVLPGVDFTIMFSDVELYDDPGNIYGTSTWGGSISYNARYEYRIDYTRVPLTLEIVSGGTFRLEGSSSLNITYKLNDGDWTEGTFGSTSFSVEAGDVIQMKGDNAKYFLGTSNYSNIDVYTGRYNVYGNIMSLVSSTSFYNLTEMTEENAFAKIFENSTVVNAQNLVLPATSLTRYCYYSMFESCTSLTTAPELPASALTGYCYNRMFYNCPNLENTPDLTHITTLAEMCMAHMFYGCSSLTTAELTDAATVSYCYYYMFNGCSSLSYVKCLIDTHTEADTQYWMKGVSSSGTFMKKSGVSWTSGTSGIPTNWTVEES